MGGGRVPCSIQAKLVSTAEIPTCLQCDRDAWCVSLRQLLVFWVVLEESIVLDLLKSFECHWTSIIVLRNLLKPPTQSDGPPQCFSSALFGSHLQLVSFHRSSQHPSFLGPEVALILGKCTGICSSLNILTAFATQRSQIFNFPRKWDAESLRFPCWWL